ncbi:unnamed protein product [Phytophthora fragariaefolia]|uniref:Unnamed protein product n=1 Tax=Phytophthora fragariaefolia TaxID=1490495 RepID=A0A9W6XQB5_9STRA|nr:unnamed protein product [Phytophthora fragariaefolia]
MVQVAIWEVPEGWYKWQSGRYQRSGTSVDQIDTGTWPSDRHDNIQVQGWYQENGTSADQIDTVAGLHIQATSTLVRHALMDTFRWATCSVVTIHSWKHYYWQKATDICQ